jgi:hypothetical protein
MAAADQTPEAHEFLAKQEPSIHGPRTMASGISLSETTVGRELRALGYRKISARPRHFAQNELAIDDFKKGISHRTGRDPQKAPGRNRNRAVVAGVSRARKQSGGLFSRQTPASG